jgi:hypothetical protein
LWKRYKGQYKGRTEQQAYDIIVEHLKNILYYNYDGPAKDRLQVFKDRVVNLLMELNDHKKTKKLMQKWEYELHPWGGTLLDTPENKMRFDIELGLRDKKMP